MKNTEDDYYFAAFMNGFLGEPYQDNDGKLFVVYQNNLFDANGWVGVLSEYEDLLHWPDSKEEAKIDSYMYLLKKRDYDTTKFREIIEDFERSIQTSLDEIYQLTNTQFIRYIQEDKIRLVRENGRERVLIVVQDVIDPPLDMIEEIYVTLSDLGVTPFVYQHGQIDIYGNLFLYLLTDYLPLTLRQVTDTSLKNDLLKRALMIAYAIQGMGYCNQDLHDGNFLYDQNKDKLYAIDFMDLTPCDSSTNKIRGIFLEDLNIRASLEEIRRGVY